MQKAIWNGQVLYADEVAENFDFETEVRKASSNKQLRCTDLDCEKPTVRYCNGGKEEPYFAHLSNCECDYCKYEKKSTSTVEIMKTVSKILKNKGYKIDIERKLFPGHITQITADLGLNNVVAVDFVSRQKGVYEIEGIAEEYESRGIKYTFVVADENMQLLDETRAFFAKRYALNKHNLLMISMDGSSVKQIALDTNDYFYKGEICTFPPEYNTELFSVSNKTENLVFEHNHLSTPHFEGKFKIWLDEKLIFFEKWKTAVDKEEEDAAKREAERIKMAKIEREAWEKAEAEREAERKRAEAEELIRKAAIIEEKKQEKEENLKKNHPKLLKVMEILNKSTYLAGRFQYRSSKGFETRKKSTKINGLKIYKDCGISVGTDDYTTLLLFILENNSAPEKDYSGTYFINIDLSSVEYNDIENEVKKHLELS